MFDDLEAQFLSALRSDAVALRTLLNNVLPECVVQGHDFNTILSQRSNWFVHKSSIKGTYGSVSYLEHLQQVCFADVLCCSLPFHTESHLTKPPRFSNKHSIPHQTFPTQPNPTQPNPTQPNPIQIGPNNDLGPISPNNLALLFTFYYFA